MCWALGWYSRVLHSPKGQRPFKGNSDLLAYSYGGRRRIVYTNIGENFLPSASESLCIDGLLVKWMTDSSGRRLLEKWVIAFITRWKISIEEWKLEPFLSNVHFHLNERHRQHPPVGAKWNCFFFFPCELVAIITSLTSSANVDTAHCSAFLVSNTWRKISSVYLKEKAFYIIYFVYKNRNWKMKREKNKKNRLMRKETRISCGCDYAQIHLYYRPSHLVWVTWSVIDLRALE